MGSSRRGDKYRQWPAGVRSWIGRGSVAASPPPDEPFPEGADEGTQTLLAGVLGLTDCGQRLAGYTEGCVLFPDSFEAGVLNAEHARNGEGC